MKEFKINLLWSNVMQNAILEIAFSFWLAFLHDLRHVHWNLIQDLFETLTSNCFVTNLYLETFFGIIYE